MENSNIDKEKVDSLALLVYSTVKGIIENQTNEQSPSTTFDVNAFRKNTVDRIYDSKAYKYTKEQIRSYLLNPEKSEKIIRDVSLYLYQVIQEYKNVVNYYGKMLTHDFLLVPNKIVREVNDKKFINSFYDNLDFLENYNIKSKLSKIESILLREDFYYAYEISDGENFIWKQLPSDYCRILGLDEFECYTFEFDFSYFDKRNSLKIDDFPSEFKNKYNIYKSKSSMRWQELNQVNAICFKFDTSVLWGSPQFMALFISLLELEDYRDLMEDSTKTDNFKLISMSIPLNEKAEKVNQYMISLDHAKDFYNNARNNIGEKIGVIAHPFKDVKAINLNENKFDENIVAKAAKNIFDSVGMSQLLGNGGDSSVGLERSINNDETLMFGLLRQYELFFKKRLSIFNAESKFKWKILFPDLTFYNRKDMFDTYMKAGQAGFNKFYILASLGISQATFIALSNIENNQLRLVEDLLSVLSSNNSITSSKGRPKKDKTKLADKTIVGIDDNSNAERS